MCVHYSACGAFTGPNRDHNTLQLTFETWARLWHTTDDNGNTQVKLPHKLQSQSMMVTLYVGTYPTN